MENSLKPANDAQKAISFFIPCYNEAENIANTLATIEEAMTHIPNPFEIIVVDDNSRDATASLVRDIALRKPQLNIRLIRNLQNRGLGFNYFRASFFASGRYYMLVNGDNVEPKETIQAIVSRAGEADMIIPHFGSQDQRTATRRRISWVFTRIVNTLTGNKIKYYNGPVLHLTENVRFWRAETLGYGYQAELICRLLHEGKSYVQVPVKNSDRQWGNSKAFALGNILSVSNSVLHIFWRRLEYGAFKLLTPGIADTESNIVLEDRATTHEP